MSGITRFDYPDNRNQIESRNFTLDLAANPPQVVASEFVRVLKPRQGLLAMDLAAVSKTVEA